MRTLLDTNVLMLPAQRRVDPYRLEGAFTLGACIAELKRLAKRDARARLALDIARAKKLRVVRASGAGDAAIVRYAKRHKCRVATSDAALIKRLKKEGVPVARLRQGKYFVEE